MDDIRDLQALQLDALREVENIGAGHAATALSQMTGHRIMISVPQVSITRLEDVAGLLGDPPPVVAAILLHMLGDLTGRTLLVFPERAALRLCDLLLKRAPGATAVITSAYLDFGSERDYVLCVETAFQFGSEGEELRGHFLLVPDLASLRVILRAVRLT